MNINIKATGMDLTTAITDYVNKKVQSLERFIKNKDAQVFVEIGKTTQHHKNGEFYRAEIQITAGDIHTIVQAEKDDLYAAIDVAKEELYRKMVETKDRKQTLFTRGARSVKKMIKGLSSRNPFTSKY